MFQYSTQHPWQSNESVQQILVFSSQEGKDKFEAEMKKRFEKAMDGYAGVDPEYPTRVKNDLSDSDAGAIYKLRAVKTNDGKFAAVIRDGFTAQLLWEDRVTYSTPEGALLVCYRHLVLSVKNSQFPIS